MWVTQAKQLIRLFNVDLKAMVNGLIKINDEYDVDFTFVDKVLTHTAGLDRDELMGVLKLSDKSHDVREKLF